MALGIWNQGLVLFMPNYKFETTNYFFFFFAGLLLPKLPFVIFPFLVFLSPLPMILIFVCV